jgi:hypothetical protein
VRFNRIMDLRHVTAQVRLNMRLTLSCITNLFSHLPSSPACSVVLCPEEMAPRQIS